MKTSCNGCRVLRKGCSDDCTIRPCLQWIKSSDSQAHATVFLAKFYGRIGLLNLISAGPDHHRPAIFRSMLYEACGRIVDPIRGSVGLLWSGKWQLCQAAVEAVLQGLPITPIGSSDAAPSGSTLTPPLKPYDIRHVDKRSAPADLNKVVLHRSRYKRSAPAGEKRPRPASSPADPGSTGLGGPGWKRFYPVEAPRAPSHESGSRESESLFSVGSSHVSQAEPSVDKAEEGEVGLELTLGFKPAALVAGCGRGGAVQD